MAIKNEEIIATEKMLRNITEEMHTFEKWKSLGYSVKKGEKSEIKFPIWKYSNRKKSDKTEEEENEKSSGYCFMKMSAFFLESQVEPMPIKTGK